MYREYALTLKIPECIRCVKDFGEWGKDARRYTGCTSDTFTYTYQQTERVFVQFAPIYIGKNGGNAN